MCIYGIWNVYIHAIRLFYGDSKLNIAISIFLFSLIAKC